MKKFCLSTILIILLPVFYFSSCAKEENTETEPPAISDIRINKNDTVMYVNAVDNKIITVKINDSLNTNPDRMDTVVTTKWMYIAARFTDNEGLSTYKVEIKPVYKDKRNREDVKDSIMPVVRLGQMIFGEKDITVYRNRLIQIPDTIFRMKTLGSTDTLAIYLDTVYHAKIACIDRAGNGDSITDYKVVLMNRRKLYNVRVGNK